MGEFRTSKVGSLQSQTSLSSQKETNIKGSQVLGNKINLTAQNLNIESLQDTMTYKGKQQNISAQATVGYCTGSLPCNILKTSRYSSP
ncbi:hemagglutinin repeat-containing protein [Haemophilus haemoglobinophilus]|nr:hemagglutinin repeat-containing protein [Canicola haemoglobinophilus]MBN6712255.1 hemagglutinin repeat-containing protein [Canicola haemoglobinophilus]